MRIKPIWNLHSNFSMVGWAFLIWETWFLFIRHTEKASSLFLFLTAFFEKRKSCKESQEQPGQVWLERLILRIGLISHILVLIFIYEITVYTTLSFSTMPLLSLKSRMVVVCMCSGHTFCSSQPLLVELHVFFWFTAPLTRHSSPYCICAADCSCLNLKFVPFE